jgi:uncharacterized protein
LWIYELMNKAEVLKILRQERPFLEKECGVKTLVLFGSSARDEMTESSDVDLLVEFDGPATSKRYFDAQFRLEDALGKAVDLITLKSVKPRLLPFIQKDAVVVE